MYAANQGPPSSNDDNDKGSRFYEDAGDLLQPFRARYGGGRMRKDNKDPYGLDPDVVQAKRTDKLINSAREMGIDGW